MIKAQQAVIDVQADNISVARRVAGWLVEQISKSTDRFTLCLSGGRTPKLLYETLALPEFSKQIQWSKVHLFWGDERFVPRTSDLSNYKMVKTALLDHISIPQSNVHAIPTEGVTPEEAATIYEKELQAFYGDNKLKANQFLFDVTLLGLGNDGHTASLFPGDAALAEQSAWVKAVVGVKEEDRITLTFPVLQSSVAVAFLVTGLDKNAILKEIMNGSDELPAGKLKPEGTLYWFLDQTAYLTGSSSAV